jgi:hypothetical protein
MRRPPSSLTTPLAGKNVQEIADSITGKMEEVSVST